LGGRLFPKRRIGGIPDIVPVAVRIRCVLPLETRIHFAGFLRMTAESGWRR
jgi:hypothetical protein